MGWCGQSLYTTGYATSRFSSIGRRVPVSVRRAWSSSTSPHCKRYTASAFAGERFLLVGDAGLFIDPLSSEGVHKAMASAIIGAVVVNTILRRPAMTRHAISFYEETQRTTY